jgi:hypothetical protein
MGILDDANCTNVAECTMTVGGTNWDREDGQCQRLPDEIGLILFYL